MVVLGLGFGLVLPTMSLVVQNAVGHQYIGVASSSSQFFRQIGSVLGIAIFGSILANSYHDEFAVRFTAEDRAAVGERVSTELDDPTIKLNKREYAVITAQVRALPDGQAILDRAARAQGESVVLGVQRIYYGAFAAAILCAVFAIIMKELPLRRTMAMPQPEAAGASPEPGAAGAAAGAATAAEGAPGGLGH
jgi:hypothetical protein